MWFWYLWLKYAIVYMAFSPLNVYFWKFLSLFPLCIKLSSMTIVNFKMIPSLGRGYPSKARMDCLRLLLMASYSGKLYLFLTPPPQSLQYLFRLPFPLPLPLPQPFHCSPPCPPHLLAVLTSLPLPFHCPPLHIPIALALHLPLPPSRV